MTDRQRFILTLHGEPAGPDRFGRQPMQRLRGALKVLLRRFGLRCESVEEREAADARDDRQQTEPTARDAP